MLNFENLEKTFKLKNGYKNNVLKGINLKFCKGDFVTVLGESGSGKSTLLNILGGLDNDFTGNYIIDGKNSKEMNWDNFRKENIGFIFQNFNLIPNLTVLKNVELAMIVRGITKEKRVKKAKEILTKVGLKEHFNKKPEFLSGGEQQRVAIARALVNNPDIILADEPTGQLDTETAKEILDLIKELCKDKLVIMASHMEEFAEEYSTRIIRITDGKIFGEEKLKTLEINDKTNIKENDLKKCANKDLFLMALKNSFSRKRHTILTLLIMIISMSTFMLILGIGIGEKQNINQIISQDYDTGKFVVYYNGNSPLLYKDYKDQLESIESIHNIYFETMLMPIFDFNKDNDIKSQLIPGYSIFGELELETYFADKNSDIAKHIIAGNYPSNKDEILIGRKTAINLVFDYYDKNNIDKNKVKEMSDHEILSEIKKLNIAYFTECSNNCPSSYQINNTKYMQLFKNSLKISGIIDDDKIMTFSQLNTNNVDSGYYTARLFVTQELFYEIVNQYNNKPSDTNIMDYYHPNYFLIETESNDYQAKINTIKDVLAVNPNFNYFTNQVDDLYNNINRNSLFMIDVGITASSIIFLISTIITGGLIFASMKKRKREFGTLFSLGYKRKTLQKLLVFEGMILSFIGLILTFIVTLEAKRYLNDFYIKLFFKDINKYQKLNLIPIKWYLVLISFILLIIAYALPVRKFKKLQIIDALREE